MEVLPIHISKEIATNDNLARLISDSAQIREGDVLVVAQKIISKQEGRLVNLDSVKPSLLAEGIASQYSKDSRIVELILSESKRIVRMGNGIIIVQTHNGFVCANAGIDESNVPHGYASLLPLDADASAKKLRDNLHDITGKNTAIIISDTFGRPFRMGQTNCAIGIAGIDPTLDYAGTRDTFDKTLRVTAIAVVDELCSAAELVMEKTKNCPVVIIRGYSFQSTNKTISELVRPKNEDLFK